MKRVEIIRKKLLEVGFKSSMVQYAELFLRFCKDECTGQLWLMIIFL